MLEFIDSHSHMYSEEFDEDRKEAVERARNCGISHIIMPDIDSSARDRMLRMEEEFPGFATALAGLHPTSVGDNYKSELKEVEKILAQRPFSGIGEIGIDLYWDRTYMKEQIYVFEYQLGLAQDLGLPVVIHARKSMDEIFASLKKFKDSRGIMHCFPGDTAQAQRAVDKGFYLGIGGVVTFKNSKMAEVVKSCGLEHIVLETDSPYLTPVPYRGKRNESANIRVIAEYISGLTDKPLEYISEVTTKNTLSIFKY